MILSLVSATFGLRPRAFEVSRHPPSRRAEPPLLHSVIGARFRVTLPDIVAAVFSEPGAPYIMRNLDGLAK